jgi:hypothetical protein
MICGPFYLKSGDSEFGEILSIQEEISETGSLTWFYQCKKIALLKVRIKRRTPSCDGIS